jgi:hypothetical protein
LLNRYNCFATLLSGKHSALQDLSTAQARRLMKPPRKPFFADNSTARFDSIHAVAGNSRWALNRSAVARTL